jgi:hypothetical protein
MGRPTQVSPRRMSINTRNGLQRRKPRARTFLDTSVPNNTTFVKQMASENVNISYYQAPALASTNTTVPGYVTDTYTKDRCVAECIDKKITNGFLAKHANPGDVCMVLDGERARTTKYLLKVGVSSVTIPNNSSSYVKLSKYAIKKNNVTVKNDSLHNVIKSTVERFDVIYMDTCGMFTTSDKYDLKESIRKCFHRNLLKDGGIFGVTITSRTNGTIVNAKQVCNDWIVETSGLRNVFTHTYGAMTTMFFKL